ncbi:MAG: MFS transporter [Rhizobiaceae bacterium]|nr:MFS transporter [Rhizobiaceae bacterium]
MSPLKHQNPAWQLTALSLAMALPSLGTSIANVALPAFAESFMATPQDVQWVVIAYLLAVTTTIVTAGRLGDMFGRRRLLLLGMVVFSAAALLGAFASQLWMLVMTRAMQGLGAAIMMALAVAMVGDLVPAERTGRAMGLLGTMSAAGTALGPSLGGLLISAMGWHAIFAFMAAAGAASWGLARQVLPAEALSRQPASLDVTGMVLLAFSLSAYALAATMQGGIQSAMMLIGLAIGGFIAFLIVQSKVTSPLVRLDLFSRRSLSAGIISLALVSSIMMATLVIAPFYLSDVLQLDALAIGLVMSVGPVVAALVGVPAGRLVDRAGATRVVNGGLIAVAGGSLLMLVLPEMLGTSGYILSLVTITAGYGLFQAGNNTSVMNGTTKEQRGVTSGLLSLGRNVGLISGASTMGTLFVLGSQGVLPVLGQGSDAGLQLTFAVGALLAGIALVASRWGVTGRMPEGDGRD